MLQKGNNTVCPRSSDPFYHLCSNLLYKLGHYFLDIQYNGFILALLVRGSRPGKRVQMPEVLFLASVLRELLPILLVSVQRELFFISPASFLTYSLSFFQNSLLMFFFASSAG